MTGPAGIAEGSGGAPRSSGTKWQRSASPPGIQEQGSPRAPFSEGPVSARAAPVSGSASQRATPSELVRVKAKLSPDGDQKGGPRPPSAPVTACVSPPSRSTTEKRTNGGAACIPLWTGLILRPASRSMGAARSSIPGMLSPCARIIRPPDGLTSAWGKGAASRISTTSGGGVR